MKKARLIGIIAVIVLSIPANGFTVSIPDTGQIVCYDAAGNIIDPCPAKGDDSYGQDCQYQPQHPRSYTKLGLNGVELGDDALPADQGGPSGS